MMNKQDRRFTSVLLAVSTVAVTSLFAVSAEEETPKPYDYSSPETSFRSWQAALRRKDAEGIVVHVWQISKGWPQPTIYSGISLKEAMTKFTSLESFSWEAVDHSMLSEHLKLSEATFVKEIGRSHGEEKGKGVTVCRVLIEWIEPKKQAHVDLYKFDGTEQWWFWPTFGCGDRIRTFDSRVEQRK